MGSNRGCQTPTDIDRHTSLQLPRAKEASVSSGHRELHKFLECATRSYFEISSQYWSCCAWSSCLLWDGGKRWGNLRTLHELQLTMRTLILTLISYSATFMLNPVIMRSMTKIDLPALKMMFALGLAASARLGATTKDMSVTGWQRSRRILEKIRVRDGKRQQGRYRHLGTHNAMRKRNTAMSVFGPGSMEPGCKIYSWKFALLKPGFQWISKW